MSEQVNVEGNKPTTVTMEHLFDQLRERVSMSNAKLLLQSAAVRSGLDAEAQEPLNMDQAKAICLQLINNGGPSFHVGKSVYQTLQ